MRGLPFTAAIGAMLALAQSVAESKGTQLAAETQLQVARIMASRQRTRSTLNAKGTRVWRDRAHRTEVRNAEHRQAKRAARG